MNNIDKSLIIKKCVLEELLSSQNKMKYLKHIFVAITYVVKVLDKY
jgi:hypothetical protein